MWPVPAQYRISTHYGARGPMWSCSKNAAGGVHTGADIKCPHGTPIYAPISGQIRHRNYGKPFGPYQFAISPDADQPFGKGEFFVAHCLSRLPDGTRVVAGQKISEIGALGNASGPHGHFEYHPTSKNIWSCTNHANPQPLFDWQPMDASPPPAAGSSAWLFPPGKKVYAKYLKWEGHELNSDKVSDSIKCWQEMLNKHSLAGGSTLPVTGKWYSQTALETQKCQIQHVPPEDQPLEAVYVGPKQFAHVMVETKCPYDWVGDDTAETPVAPPTASDRPEEPSLLYPGAVWDPIPKDGGGWFTGLRPFSGTAKKLTLHTTQTSAKPNWAAQQSGIPHLTVHLGTGQKWQHLAFDTAAYTLKGGDHSPNSDSGLNIQIEIIGYTHECPVWPQAHYDALSQLLAWCSDQLDIPYTFPVPFTAGTRLSWQRWEGLDGVLGHLHAPWNDHSDPTGLRTDLLGPAPVQPPIDQEIPIQPLPEPPTAIDEQKYVTKDEWNVFRNEVVAVLERLIDIVEP